MQPGLPPNVPQLPIPMPSFIEGNPYFSAGFGLAILGFGMQCLRKSGVYLQLFSTRSFLTTLEISNHDPSFTWVMQWLNHNSGSTFRRVCPETVRRQTQSGKSITNFSLVPAQGRHFIKYRGTYLMVDRDRELRARGGQNESTGMTNVWESIKFSTIGRDPSIYTQLLHDAQQLATEKDHDYTTIYTSWGHQGWKPFGNARRKRDINSVILDEGVTQEIVDDVFDFICQRQWYIERGIPYRRGYLLYGEPGSGKSSFVQALAGHMGYDICVMSLAQPGLTDDHLAISLINVPEKSLILFEDVDCLFSQSAPADVTKSVDMINRKKVKPMPEEMYSTLHSSEHHNNSHRRRLLNNNNYISFSGFLNALDGVSAGEERVVFMTTNFIEQLDAALIRPGRIDVLKYFGYATQHQIRQMLYRFYPELVITESDVHIDGSQLNSKLKLNDKIDFFVECLHTKGMISMAELQEYFMLHKDSPLDALNNVDLFVQTLMNSPRRNKSNILNDLYINQTPHADADSFAEQLKEL